MFGKISDIGQQKANDIGTVWWFGTFSMFIRNSGKISVLTLFRWVECNTWWNFWRIGKHNFNLHFPAPKWLMFVPDFVFDNSLSSCQMSQVFPGNHAGYATWTAGGRIDLPRDNGEWRFERTGFRFPWYRARPDNVFCYGSKVPQIWAIAICSIHNMYIMLTGVVTLLVIGHFSQILDVIIRRLGAVCYVGIHISRSWEIISWGRPVTRMLMLEPSRASNCAGHLSYWHSKV